MLISVAASLKSNAKLVGKCVYMCARDILGHDVLFFFLARYFMVLSVSGPYSIECKDDSE